MAVGKDDISAMMSLKGKFYHIRFTEAAMHGCASTAEIELEIEIRVLSVTFLLHRQSSGSYYCQMLTQCQIFT